MKRGITIVIACLLGLCSIGVVPAAVYDAVARPDPGPAYSLAAPVLEVAVTDADTIVVVPSPYYRVDPLTGVETEGQREHYVALSRFVSMHPGHWTDGQNVRHDVLRLVVAGDFDVITLPPDGYWARAWAELEMANPGGVVRLEDWQ